jgi:hypothetical protein
VTLRRPWKAGGFFRLSSVVDRLRTEAWLRLGAHRSGGGKAHNQSLHSGVLIAGRCPARCRFRAWHKGKNGPQLVIDILESSNTCLFRGLFLGNVPTRLEAFPTLFFGDATLPKAVDWLPVPSSVERADTLANAVTFLPTALRGGTRTLFSSQGTAHVFFLKEQKVEMLPARVKTLRETRLTAASRRGAACGGFSVMC